MIKEYKKQLPILPIKWSILIYDSHSDFQSKFPNIEFIPSGSDFLGGTFSYEDRFYLALLLEKDLTRGVIAHECNHLVNQFFKYVAYRTDPDNDEMHCYFLTYLVDETHKVLDKYQ